MRRARWLTLLPLLLLESACSTTRVSLSYDAAQVTAPATARPLISVGTFADQRDIDPHWLGTIRGLVGEPLKMLELQDTASEMMSRAFREALAARGLLVAGESGRYRLTGTITKFDCSQLMRREAYAEITVTITDTETGKVVLDQPYHHSIVTGEGFTFDSGIFASPEDLKAVAARVLRTVIDDVLDSNAFAEIVSGARRS